LESLQKFTQTQPVAWGLFRKLQNTQNLKNNERLNSIFQESTQNLKRQGFSKLPQIDQSKRRSLRVDHIPDVRFEFGGLGFQEI
jgi:hypothetical protein